MFIIFSKLLKGGFSHLQADLSGKAQRRSGIWPHSRHQQHIGMAWRKGPSPALRPQPSLWINTAGWNAASHPPVHELMAIRKPLTALSCERPGLWGGPASCCVTVM